MVLAASQELRVMFGMANRALDRQHMLAAIEADNKWQAQQSRLKTEAAQQFQVRAIGWAALGGAFGLGSILTLVVEHLLVR